MALAAFPPKNLRLDAYHRGSVTLYYSNIRRGTGREDFMINNNALHPKAQGRQTLSLPFGKTRDMPATRPIGTLSTHELKRIVATMLD